MGTKAFCEIARNNLGGAAIQAEGIVHTRQLQKHTCRHGLTTGATSQDHRVAWQHRLHKVSGAHNTTTWSGWAEGHMLLNDTLVHLYFVIQQQISLDDDPVQTHKLYYGTGITPSVVELRLLETLNGTVLPKSSQLTTQQQN